MDKDLNESEKRNPGSVRTKIGLSEALGGSKVKHQGGGPLAVSLGITSTGTSGWLGEVDWHPGATLGRCRTDGHGYSDTRLS